MLIPALRHLTNDPLPSRVLHLIDAENLLGGPDFTHMAATCCRLAYEATAPVGQFDQVILATSHHAALPAWLAWPTNTRRLLRSGPSGADLALIGVLATERIEQR